MVFKSDKQRIGFFSSRSFIRSQLKPLITKSNRLSNPTRKPKLTTQVRSFLSKKISKNIKEGKPAKQAIAIAFSQARKKFPKQKKSLEKVVGNPNGKLTTKRIVNLLVLLFGVSVALRLLRQARK